MSELKQGDDCIQYMMTMSRIEQSFIIALTGFCILITGALIGAKLYERTHPPLQPIEYVVELREDCYMMDGDKGYRLKRLTVENLEGVL